MKNGNKTSLKPMPATTDKQMILRVSAHTHAWIKKIAESTDTTQPNVVTLILGDAVQNEPVEYINRIKNVNAKKALQQLEEDIKMKEAERKRLTELLKNESHLPH